MSSDTSPFRRLRYRVTSSSLRVPVLWFRHRGFRPGDVFLGSYPRSGSTWLRFTLFELLTGETATFDSVNRNMRGPGTHDQGRPVLPARGRFLSTHEPYRNEYHRAVYLVRDVRDVVLSEFQYDRERGFVADDFDAYLRQMLSGRKKYGSWTAHVTSWLDSPAARAGNLLLLRYEDLRQSPETVLSTLLDFLGRPTSPSAIVAAVRNNSLEAMRAKEDALHARPQLVRFPEKPAPPATEDGRFVRQGRVGGWRQQLPPAAAALLEDHAGDVLHRLGYPASTSIPEVQPTLTAR
jgi:hypothetical protein